MIEAGSEESFVVKQVVVPQSLLCQVDSILQASYRPFRAIPLKQTSRSLDLDLVSVH
jgi:hypothetical protein